MPVELRGRRSVVQTRWATQLDPRQARSAWPRTQASTVEAAPVAVCYGGEERPGTCSALIASDGEGAEAHGLS
jgi:hypothetical protein